MKPFIFCKSLSFQFQGPSYQEYRQFLLGLMVWAGILGPCTCPERPPALPAGLPWGSSAEAHRAMSHVLCVGPHTSLCSVPNVRKCLLTWGSLFPSPALGVTVLPVKWNPPACPAFETKKQGILLPLYSSLEEMKPEPGSCLMWDKREGETRGGEREAAILCLPQSHSLPEGVTIPVVISEG